MQGDIVSERRQSATHSLAGALGSVSRRAGQIAIAREKSEIHDMVETYRQRISFCYDALDSTYGIKVSPPEGAFYLFPRVEGVRELVRVRA